MEFGISFDSFLIKRKDRIPTCRVSIPTSPSGTGFPGEGTRSGCQGLLFHHHLTSQLYPAPVQLPLAHSSVAYDAPASHSTREPDLQKGRGGRLYPCSSLIEPSSITHFGVTMRHQHVSQCRGTIRAVQRGGKEGSLLRVCLVWGWMLRRTSG